MGLFDIHAHLTEPRLAVDEEAILARARAAGVTTIVSNGLHPDDNAAVLALARRAPEVKPAIGLYPVDAVLDEMEDLGVEYPRSSNHTADESIAWVRDHLDEAVAVGEIGLDHYWVPAELWELQEQRFRKLVALAMEADKPIIVHTRKAELRTLEVLQEMGATRVCWHCFSSKVKLGRRIAEAGHWLSIPANVQRAENFQRLVQTLPREKVLLETDCPYLGPDREALNEPANVRVTATYAAETWGCTVEEVTSTLEENFEALMGFAP